MPRFSILDSSPDSDTDEDIIPPLFSGSGIATAQALNFHAHILSTFLQIIFLPATPYTEVFYRNTHSTTLDNILFFGLNNSGLNIFRSNIEPNHQARLDAINFPVDCIPENFICLISSQIMTFPVFDPRDNNRVERDTYIKIIREKGENPFNRQRLSIIDLTIDHHLADNITNFVQMAEKLAAEVMFKPIDEKETLLLREKYFSWLKDYFENYDRRLLEIKPTTPADLQIIPYQSLADFLTINFDKSLPEAKARAGKRFEIIPYESKATFFSRSFCKNTVSNDSLSTQLTNLLSLNPPLGVATLRLSIILLILLSGGTNAKNATEEQISPSAPKFGFN